MRYGTPNLVGGKEPEASIDELCKEMKRDQHFFICAVHRTPPHPVGWSPLWVRFPIAVTVTVTVTVTIVITVTVTVSVTVRLAFMAAPLLAGVCHCSHGWPHGMPWVGPRHAMGGWHRAI